MLVCIKRNAHPLEMGMEMNEGLSVPPAVSMFTDDSVKCVKALSYFFRTRFDDLDLVSRSQVCKKPNLQIVCVCVFF